jgi:hypothetical protein
MRLNRGGVISDLPTNVGFVIPDVIALRSLRAQDWSPNAAIQVGTRTT